MMRRFTPILAILLTFGTVAAIALAQTGGDRSNSLADRLMKLRQSSSGGSATTATGPSATSPSAPARRYTAPTRSGATTSRPIARVAQAETAADASTRRPRLLSQLDPRNLLSLGGFGDDDPSASGPATVPGNNPRANRARSGLLTLGGSDTRTNPMRSSAATEDGNSPVSTRVSAAQLGPQPSSRPSPSGRIASSDNAAPDRVTVEEVDDAIATISTPSGDATALPQPPETTIQPSARYAQPLQSSTDILQSPLSAASIDGPSNVPEIADSASDALSGATAPAEQPLPDAIGTAKNDTVDSAEEPAAVGHEYLYADEAETQTSAPPTPDTVAQDDSWQTEPEHQSTATNSYDESLTDTTRVLSSDRVPAISWEVAGPQQIILGRKASYQIRIENQDSASAERLVIRLKVPPSLEVTSAETTHGMSQRVNDSAAASVLEWRIDNVQANQKATLDLAVVPRTSEPVDFAISVHSEPKTSMARVAVLEPKLQIALEGPSDVLFGETRTYRMTVSNPGTGPADNVVISLTPPGETDAAAKSHQIGQLKPGETKTVDVDVTPQTPGDVSIVAVATATGSLRDSDERRMLVRKPELVVDVRGPKTTYAGTVATYYFRVKNPGDATASDVNVEAHLPLGSEFVRASEDQKPKGDDNAIAWNLGALPPGEEAYLEVRCIVNWAGDNALEVAARSKTADLHHKKSINTHVVALADLKLEIADPRGPVAVGREAEYELRVKNRGSNTAEDVNVVALFSEGIDPVGVEGGQHAIENGRVAFRTIESLPAGREITFKIRAVASQPGTHVFRAEVLCRELETKLAAEETTRFYRDETIARGDKNGTRSARSAEAFRK